ncbi:MAG: hypothetical protein K2H29_12415 [Oscillospiraceae bacterium]|nr:hypothetical protein [Oscillospiraceae bacterium]
MLKILIFNSLLILTEIIFYAGKFLNSEQKFIAGLVGVILFWSVNYYLLRLQDLWKFSRCPQNIRDCENSLKYWLSRSNPFREELKTARNQLECFLQKQTALRELTAQNAVFKDVSLDAEKYLLQNFRKILTRMRILDFQLSLKHPSGMQTHKIYFYQILEQNQEFLHQYENFVIEISQLGAEENKMPCLSLMTEALQELRNQDI